MPVTYAFFNVALVLGYTTVDWTKISKDIQQQRIEDEELQEQAAMQGGGKGQEHEEQSVGLVPASPTGDFNL
jgi:hypothetical protein